MHDCSMFIPWENRVSPRNLIDRDADNDVDGTGGR